MRRGTSFSFAIVALLIALCPSLASAQKSHAIFNGRSYHLDASYDWNEDNYGFGLEHEFEQKSAWKKVVMANGFRDSNDNMSWMAGVGLHRRIFETEKLAGFYVYTGLNAFIMTREDAGRDPFPGILPSVSVGNDKFGVNLTYLPRQAVEAATEATVRDPTLSGILFVQFKISMDQLLL